MACGILSDLDQATILTQADKIVRNVDTIFVLLRVLGVTVFVSPLIEVLYKLVMRYASLHEVVGHELVHRIVLVFEVVLSQSAVHILAMRLDRIKNSLRVGHGLCLLIIDRRGHAPFLLEDIVSFNKSRETKVTVSGCGNETLHTGNAVRIGFALYFFVFTVNTFIELVCPTRCLQQGTHDTHVGRSLDQTGDALIGRGDNRRNGVYISITQFRIALHNA